MSYDVQDGPEISAAEMRIASFIMAGPLCLAMMLAYAIGSEYDRALIRDKFREIVKLWFKSW